MDEDEAVRRTEAAIKKAKIDAFGDKAHLARHRTVGSTISETIQISLNVRDNPDFIQNMPLPWTENRNMIISAFEDFFRRSHICPGLNNPRCCHAAAGKYCFPNWQEREDPEWYAQQINLLLSQINDRITQSGPLVPALAADEAFELGRLFTEAVNKFNWDEHAKRGLKTVKSARRGGADGSRVRAGQVRSDRYLGSINPTTCSDQVSRASFFSSSYWWCR
ncbi:hypothetical protein [Rhizorhapis sp. SPR117]|uniref:hypothetical protein n=1 Tax=Rhizorhapis sp. SPR117 TaxID=2912611 RepID=UPI001F391596|nr:hypothetical protein [Rhizorhapis sp. SPR117]